MWFTGCAMSGLIADAKTLIDKARVETQVWLSLREVCIYVFFYFLLLLVFLLCSLFLKNHWFTYNETMTVESVTQAVSNLALQFGEEDADPGAMVSPLHPMGKCPSTFQAMP
jgi:20S proteasome subunit alpha 5